MTSLRAFRSLLFCPVIAALPSLGAAEPILLLHIDGSVNLHGGVEVGWQVQDNPADYDNCTIRICEGDDPTADILNTQNARNGITVSSLRRPGTWTLRFGGFLATCAPKLYLRIADGSANPPTLYFTASGHRLSSKIELEHVALSSTGSSFFTVEPGGGAVSVHYPR
jgi:hypothetical protein